MDQSISGVVWVCPGFWAAYIAACHSERVECELNAGEARPARNLSTPAPTSLRLFAGRARRKRYLYDPPLSNYPLSP